MMNHDPFQTYQTTGGYPQGVSPYGLPYGAVQPFINPAALASHPLANSPYGSYGINPQQLQGGFGGQNPFQNPGLQNPMLQNPMLQNPIAQNPLLQHALLHNQLQQLAWQTQLLNLAQGNQGWPQQQQQFGGYPLAPQGLTGGIGQPGGYGQQGGFGQPGGIGQPFGQIHPLAQLALRQAAGYGISPYGGSF